MQADISIIEVSRRFGLSILIDLPGDQLYRVDLMQKGMKVHIFKGHGNSISYFINLLILLELSSIKKTVNLYRSREMQTGGNTFML